MKKIKSQWKQLTRQILALGLAVVLVSGMTDFSVLAEAAQKTTAASEETVTEKVAENPAAEDKTVSGDTVSAEPKVQEAEPADDEAGIAVYADDDTASGPIEVTYYGNTTTYTTFEEMVKAVKVNTDVNIKLLGDVTDAVNWDIYAGYDYRGLNITLDLNGHEMGDKENGEWSPYLRFTIDGVPVTLKDTSGSEGKLHADIDVTYEASVTVEKGEYDTITIKEGSTGTFKGGSCSYINVGSWDGYKNEGTTCSIISGNHGSITVANATTLTITGDETEIRSLSVRSDETADITLTGGTYGSISYYSGNIADMLEDPYVLISTKTEEIIDINNETYVGGVRVAKVSERIAPTWTANAGSSEKYGIQVKETWYNSKQSTVDFENHIYNGTTLNITFRANDDSGIKKYCYYIHKVSDKETAAYTPKTDSLLDDYVYSKYFTTVEANGSKDAVTVSVPIEEDSSNFVIYAYAVDTVGNRSEYIYTDGIVIDNIVPTIDNGKGYEFGYGYTTTPTGVTIPFKVSEDVTLIYFYYDKNMAVDSSYGHFAALDKEVTDYTEEQYTSYTTNGNAFLPFVKKQDEKWIPAVDDGEKIAITADGKVEATLHVEKVPVGNGTITITGLSPYTETAIMIEAIDKAGNLLAGRTYDNYIYKCQYIRFRTDKFKPEITKVPSITGIYGTKHYNMNIEGGEVQYNGEIISGEWYMSFSSDHDTSEKLQVGTDHKCRLAFVPADENVYERVYTEVVPTVQPKEITITFKNTKLTKTYGNELPEITADDFEISAGELAFEDTTDTIAKSLSYVTDAADASADVGIYNFIVKSDSQNYDITVQYPDGATHGTVEVQQAKGVIRGSNTFNASVTKTYKDDTEFDISDWVTANHTESKISYEVVDAKNRRGRDDEIITVTPEGMVEIHNAGTATIRISLPASKNYEKSEYVEVTVTVNPKSITWEPIVKNYLYTKGGEDELTVESLVPEDFGSIKDVTCNLCTVDGESDFFKVSPQVGYAGGGYPVDINYTVNPGNIDDTVQIKWILRTNNYILNGNDEITIQLKLVDRKVVKLQGEKVNTQNTLTYGQALSNIQFGKNTFIDSDTEEVVPGTLTWTTPDVIPNAGTYEADWVFTPADDKTYMECKGKVFITVNKADPSEVTAPVFKLCYYRPTALSENPYLLTSPTYVEQPGVVKDINGKELEGTWSWVEPDLVPEVGKHTLKVRFTPTDQNYNSVESSVALEVSKSYLNVENGTKPSVPNAYTHGDYLYSQDPQNGKAGYYDYRGIFHPVEGTFSWYEENVQLSYVENKNHNKIYRVMFIPKEQDHYYEQMTRITIVVNQAEYPPTVPGDLNVKNSCTTLSDVTLPDGWSFAEADLDKVLDVDIPVTVIVTYKDTDNYINSTKEITITRSACDHEKTERRDVIKATCMTEGNTGDLWCLVCGDKLEDGTVTPKDPTNHTALTSKVIKQPTTSEEGIMEYTCSDCGYKATKAIAKIASSSSGSDDDDDDDDPAPTPTPAPTATPAPAVTPVRPNRIPVKPTVKEEPKTPAPFLRGENGKEGWEIITEAVTEAAEGDTVVVDMNGSTVVPGDVFDRIRGKDITVEFDLGDGILWKVNGKSVEKGNVGDIDFTVRTGEDANDTIPVEIINNLTGERTYMNLSLAYEGEFGFEAVLSLNVGAANAGLYANLFYYNETSKELEYLCTGEIGQDGGAELTFTHASEYTIVIDEQPMGETKETPEIAPVDDNKEDDTIVSVVPETEDSNIVVWVILGIIIAVAFIVISVILAAKRNKEEEE